MIRVNGEVHELAGESVAALVVRLGVEPRGVAVALDGEVVRRADWSTTVVPDGAVVEIVTAVAGG